MKKMIIALLFVAGATACNGQAEKGKQLSNSTPSGDNKPQASWKVNRHYDDKGNLIGYDSTYVWSYSSKNGTMQQVDVDSVMAAFRREFNTGFPSFFDNSFGEPVWSDSFFHRDFTRPDYFMNKWRSNQFDMGRMMQRMDSLRNQFLRNNYPGISPDSKKEKLPLKTL